VAAASYAVPHYSGERIYKGTFGFGAERFAGSRLRRHGLGDDGNRGSDSLAAVAVCSELVAPVSVTVCAVFATGVAFSIQLWAAAIYVAEHAAICLRWSRFLRCWTSYLFLGERLATRALFGAAFVLAGILIAELLGPAAAPESPEPVQRSQL